MAKGEPDEILPKKRAKVAPDASRGPSAPMARLMRMTRLVAIAIGGGVTVVGLMAVVGLVTDSLLARLIVALVLALVAPALVADRLLKRTNVEGGLGLVGDVFAILLLTFALGLVSLDFVTRPMLAREGDRYARAGSTTMARVVYFVAGVSPVFPVERAPAAAGSASAAASARPPGSAPSPVNGGAR